MIIANGKLNIHALAVVGVLRELVESVDEIASQENYRDFDWDVCSAMRNAKTLLQKYDALLLEESKTE